MKNSTSKLLKVTAFISMLIAVFFLIEGACLMFNILGFKDYYIKFIQEMGVSRTPEDISFQVYMGIFDAIVGLFLNSYCAGNYYKLSKTKNILLGSSKMLLYVGILQCFFVISILPGIMTIVASRQIAKAEYEIINRPREQQSSETDMDDMTMQIKSIKQQLERGEITQEQYDRTLNNIIENSAKNKIFNHTQDK